MRYTWIVVVLVSFISSCKKDDKLVSDNKNTLLSDVLKETRENYLWYNQIPSNFNEQAYEGPEELMEAIRQFSNEPGFSEPVDHYSFAIKKADWDNIAAGVTTDFGLNVFFMNEGDLRVRMVEKESPAGLAGIRRGWRITRIAGSANISTANADFIVDKVYNSQSTAFTFQLPDGSSRDIMLNAGTYQEQPLYLDTIYTEGAKKVGYLVFNSFLGSINQVKNSFNNVFNKFATNNVTDVIVDLRYNGGGYVSLQQSLANFLVKSSAHGKVMMNEEFNDKNAKNNQTFLFEKTGGLNISNIYIIVGGNTASASELLINNLKPYMNVRLVGDPTYGKPVGFFDIPVGDWLIFPVSFRSTNAAGEGNYFNGIGVDKAAADGLDKDFGDRNESALATVLTHVNSGSFGFVQPGTVMNSTLESGVKDVNKKLDTGFKGAILNR